MKYEKVTLLQIEYFLATAKHLNFTEAAKSLYVSQPSLSRQIAMLENEIGTKLFFRTNRNVRLTSAGIVLFNKINGVIESIENAIESAKEPSIGENCTLTIGCLESMNTSIFLPNIIRKFKEKHKNINLILESHSFKDLREKMINGKLDIIFTLSFEIDDSLGILWDTVYRGNSYIIMDSSHPLASRSNIRIEDLKNEKFVIISRDESPKGFDSIINICRKNGFEPKIVKQLPNVESVLLCVEAGVGVALFDSQVRYNNKNIKVFKVENDYIDVIMVWKKENMNSSIPHFVNGVLSEVKLENL